MNMYHFHFTSSSVCFEDCVYFSSHFAFVWCILSNGSSLHGVPLKLPYFQPLVQFTRNDPISWSSAQLSLSIHNAQQWLSLVLPYHHKIYSTNVCHINILPHFYTILFHQSSTYSSVSVCGCECECECGWLWLHYSVGQNESIYHS